VGSGRVEIVGEGLDCVFTKGRGYVGRLRDVLAVLRLTVGEEAEIDLAGDVALETGRVLRTGRWLLRPPPQMRWSAAAEIVPIIRIRITHTMIATKIGTTLSKVLESMTAEL